MAKRTASKQPTKKHLARAQREAKLRKRVLAAAAVIGAILIVLVAYSLVDQLVILPRSVVLTVNGDEYFVPEFQSRVEQYYTLLSASDPVSTGARVLEEMIQESVIRSEAEARGISVTDEDIEAAIVEQVLGIPADGGEGTTDGEEPALDQAAIDEALEAFLEQVRTLYGIDEDLYRAGFAIGLYQERISAELESEVDLIQEHVQLQHILVETEETALEAKERLDAGEAWEDIVLEYSIDDLTRDSAGDLGWLSLTDLLTRYGQIGIAVFASPEGDVSAPIQVTDGWHLFRATDREEREISDIALQTLIADRLDGLLEERQAEADIVVAENWQDFLPEPPVRIQQ